MRLLLVEDDPTLGMLARDGLVQRGFFVDLVATVAAARHAIAVAVYDAVILDRSLPDGDGLMLAGGLARSGTAVLFATAQDSTSARIAGLDAGGDDYIIKPYDLDEVAARIRAATRKPGPRSAGPIVYGPLTLDPSSL